MVRLGKETEAGVSGRRGKVSARSVVPSRLGDELAHWHIFLKSKVLFPPHFFRRGSSCAERDFHR
ncbi:MAG: hypothetical protein BJ554DRAFT_3803 [Olpidium bornovanus]|uniref:Uncharacterized protein n=1 Tax=Olpidium bornovanus TaxID=278681 RepID=A0A8H8A2H1_9FUNG|nr:MAG: hypothetical protein BJ554DRAFT_3803 [Olpidium bornovanus]